MARVTSSELSIEAPPGWRPRPVLLLIGPEDGRAPRAPNVVVSLEERREGESIQSRGWRRLLEHAAKRPGLDMLGTTALHVGGRAATRSDVRWNGDAGWVYETAVHVDAPDGVVSITVTTGAPLDAAGTATLERLLASVQFGAAPASSPDVTARPVTMPPPSPRASEPPPFDAASLFPMPGKRAG